MDVALLLLAGTATALATGLGAIPVFLLGERGSRSAVPVGLCARADGRGFVGRPASAGARRGRRRVVAAGPGAGVAFLLGSRAVLDRPRPARWPRCAARACAARCSCLLCCSCTACPRASRSAPPTPPTRGPRLFVILAIALQNVPEGTSVAIPMESAGFGRASSSGRRSARARRSRSAPDRLPAVEQINGAAAVLASPSRPARCSRWWSWSCCRRRYAPGGRLAADRRARQPARRSC